MSRTTRSSTQHTKATIQWPGRKAKSRSAETNVPDTESGIDFAGLHASSVALLARRLSELVPVDVERLSATIEDNLAEAISQALHATVLPALSEQVRKAVVDSMRARDAHLAHLVRIDRAIATSKTITKARHAITAEIESAGLRRVVEPERPEYFEVEPNEDDDAADWEVLIPAYVEVSSGRLVQHGRARAAVHPRVDDTREGRR
jgi:hypothetical protein